MITLRLLLTIFITTFSTLIFSAEDGIFSGWTHLELGAGNYGADGHTKTSQAKTVLMKLKNVSNEKNYIDDLEEFGHGDYKPEEQYRVLFWTLEELIKRYGDVGIFHVNDLYEEYTVFATQKLKEYASAKGYTSIVMEAVPGDYQWIDSKQTLSKYGRVKYSTVHLKNPELSFYHDQMDGDLLYSSNVSRKKTRSLLQKLANLSESGLYLFILDDADFIPLEERTEFIEKDIFYHATEEWDSVPYIFPEGKVFEKDGKVFHIHADCTYKEDPEYEKSKSTFQNNIKPFQHEHIFYMPCMGPKSLCPSPGK